MILGTAHAKPFFTIFRRNRVGKSGVKGFRRESLI